MVVGKYVVTQACVYATQCNTSDAYVQVANYAGLF